MPSDLSAVQSELRPVAKKLPKISYNRWNVKFIRLLARLQPKAKIPEDLQIEHVFIKSQDQRYRIRLRIYKPRSSAALAPVLLWMHGGGFIIGAPEMSDPCLIQFNRELGIVVVSVDYRLAPENPFPAALEDGFSALSWISAHAQSLGVDPTRIAIGGESAGGGLAATLVQMAHDRGEIRPKFQMLVYPMLDDRSSINAELARKDYIAWTQANNRFGWESYLHQPPGSAQVPAYAVAARREDLSGLPPAWISVGTLDLFNEEDLAYARKLKDCGVDCEFMPIPAAFHGFDFLDQNLPIVREFRRAQIAALKKNLY
jgi:acetyl esterase/lipase